MYKTLILILSVAGLTGSAAAQVLPSGCGDPKIKYDVQTSDSRTPVQAEAGMAVVYFIQDEVNFRGAPSLTTRVGVDGRWIGADHGRSFFAVSVTPGEHELCTSWQNIGVSRVARMAAAHFTAEGGKIYYFEVRNTLDPGTTEPIAVNRIDVSLDSIDPSEGRLLTASYKQAASHPKR